MPIDTYSNPPSAQAIENAIIPGYEREAEAARIHLDRDDEVFTGEESAEYLAKEAESLAQSTHAEYQPRPAMEAEVKLVPLDLEGIAVVGSNLRRMRDDYILAA